MSFPSPYRENGTPRRSKLTAAIACEIVQLNADGILRAEIAKRMGIAVSSVSAIVTGKSWFEETLELRKKLRKAKR